MLVIFLGPIQGERKLQNKIIEKYEKLNNNSIIKKVLEKPIEKLKNPKIDYHAWVKTKLNGKWYNADPTWDADYIRNGLEPTHALKTDEECKLENKLYNPGPKCDTLFSQKDINKIFSRNNIYIGNLKIPNMKDIKGFFKEATYEFAFYNDLFKRSFKAFTEKLFSYLKKTKALPAGKDDSSSFSIREFYDEFEQECGYTTQELLKMGCNLQEIRYFIQKYDGKTGERIDRKKRVDDWIQKNSSINAHKKFEDELRYNIGEVEPDKNQKESMSLIPDSKDSRSMIDR